MSRRATPGLGAVLSVLLVTGVPPARGQVVIETVRVGNPGNAGENSGESEPDGFGPDRICGAVDYVYEIGKYEVTAGQYTAFLNAVAATDTFDLYNTGMWTRTYGCRIERTGSSGTYGYSVVDDWADLPVNYVSWGDAARYSNWLHNGQPTGAQNLRTTEDGSYYLNGATTDEELAAVVREHDATWVVPSEDEWYKAAYHRNDGVTGNYYEYPTSSDAAPVSECCPGAENSANYDSDVSGSGGLACGHPYYANHVGCFVLSGSPYGTFDQGGNVWEWNEAIVYLPSHRGSRGGSYFASDIELTAAWRSAGSPTSEGNLKGFRVAKVSDLTCDPMDTDGDFDTDLLDFAVFQAEFTAGDLAEYALFQDCMDGPVQ